MLINLHLKYKRRICFKGTKLKACKPECVCPHNYKTNKLSGLTVQC